MKKESIKIFKDKLFNLYITKKLSKKKISVLLNCSESTIDVRLNKYNIPIRSFKEAQKINLLSSKNSDKYKKGKPKCIDCKKQLNSYTHKRCRSCYYTSTKGKNHPNWKNGKPYCLDCNRQLSNYHNKRCVKCKFKGKNHPNYIDGRTPLYNIIRGSEIYKVWRNLVFNRDNYTCQECGDNKGGNLNAHHKIAFAIILSEFLKEYDQFSPIEDKETLVRLATKYKQFWNIDNGITLCKDCHLNIPITR